MGKKKGRQKAARAGAKKAVNTGGKKGQTRPDSKAGELIDMEEAIKLLKTTRPTFYRWLRAGKIKGMKLGRQWRFYREDVERFLKGEEPRIELRADITPLVEKLHERLRALGGEFVPSDEDEVIQAVNLMILLGLRMHATDIHIEPQWKEESKNVAVLRYRVDGVLQPGAEFDLRLLPAIVERYKVMANVDTHEKKTAQDGRISVKLAESPRPVDMRVCFLPACTGESVTVRVLDSTDVRLTLDRIDYAPRDKELLISSLEVPWGTILLTGPTGSGKTTALYSCLHHVSGPGVKTVTVEDPVEYFLPHALQVQVMARAGLSFSSAARAALRSDPDVILIGEIRDFETLQLVHQSALTGHLVLTTLHADEAARGLKRMVEMGSDPFVVADSARLVISQRLIRKLCPECSEKKRRPEHLALAEELARAGGLEWDALPKTFREPVGCERCARTGFRGRNVIAEALKVTPRIGAALRRGASVEELRKTAVSQGMTTMAAHGILRAAAGETSLNEVIRALGLR